MSELNDSLRESWNKRAELLAERYRNDNDPRRNPDFREMQTDWQIRELLAAILDELQAMNRRADNGGDNSDG